MTLDAVDRKLLKMLQEDGRRSFRSLGEAVDLGAPSVHARVQRLEREGYIRGYHAHVDAEKVGRGMTAFVSIGLEGGRKGDVPRTEAIADQLRKDPDVVEVHAITGEDDLLVKVRTSDIRGLERLLLRALEPLEGVRRTTTNIVVRTLIERETAP
ncbi:MAG TPA: Lrp/AsnC family transcriptional regulator [Candidatus Thermoplasmatota archaeon]|nr:Lrp/AsnC family transcriptional regulator [Candidatus Thermoplasmatota archaeon]